MKRPTNTIHYARVKIIQPNSNYLIADHAYSREQAQEYINMLISKMEDYIAKKKSGLFVAPLMTLGQMETQLENMRLFQIVEIEYED